MEGKLSMSAFAAAVLLKSISMSDSFIPLFLFTYCPNALFEFCFFGRVLLLLNLLGCILGR
jgi:hypothetical protein